jgi:uncharacterized protein YdhG (YjbR/CyaY superfamily)
MLPIVAVVPTLCSGLSYQPCIMAYTTYMKPKTVDDYLAGFPEWQRAPLMALRTIIRNTLPDTTEALKWGAPATLDADGMILIVFSGHKEHINLVGTPSTRQAFATELAGYTTGKGSVQLAYDKPLPEELIRRFVLYRAKEYREQGVAWR